MQGGTYEIVRYISSGGFGCTYEARNTKMDCNVAIKEFFVKDFCNRSKETNRVIVATESKVELIGRLRKKFIEEAQSLYKMNHPNIVRVTDLFEENGTAYYVMDYIEGSSLNQLISEKGHLSESEALGYIRQVADALRYVHSHNRLHLDVKPHNIMVESSGRAILIDFGVSKQYDEVNGENTSTLLGCTPGYAPIEQGSRGLTEFHAATDIYALGATLYKALSGITPVEATLRASGMKLQPLPGSLSPSTASAIEKSMQLIVDNRPQSVDEFLEIVERGKSKDERAKIRNEKEERKDESEETVYPVSVVSAADDETIAPGSSKETPRDAARSSSAYSSSNEKENKTTPAKRKSKLPLIIAAVVTFLVAAAGIFFYTNHLENVEREHLAQIEKQRNDSMAVVRAEQARKNYNNNPTGTIRGHEYVDLGLPSGIKWATCNVGASSPEEYGYYAWGETSTKSDYSSSTSSTYGKDMSDIGGNARYDVARKQWGGSWRMPTKKEFQELIDNCTWEWTTQNNVNGYSVTSKSNGASIFLPAAGYRYGTSLNSTGSFGYYWSSTPYESSTGRAYGLDFGSGGHYTLWYYRFYGLSVRPVSE